MRRRLEFLRYFLLGGPSPGLLIAFALGILVMGILAELAYGLLTTPAASWPVAWRPAVVLILLTVAAYLLYRRDQRRRVEVEFDESRSAPAHAGLIWLFGPGQFDHLLFALRHHRERGGGSDCWLVMQDVEPVRERLAELGRRLVEEGVETRLHPAYVQRLEVRDAYQEVRRVIEYEAAGQGLGPEQVIADITGATKPMSAGMLLAALQTGCVLEYVESERDADGWPISGTQRVVLLDMAFYPAREE